MQETLLLKDDVWPKISMEVKTCVTPFTVRAGARTTARGLMLTFNSSRDGATRNSLER